MPYKDPERKREYQKEYAKKLYQRKRQELNEYQKVWRQKHRSTEEGAKINRINNFKSVGIIVEDWNELYDYYLLTWNCEYCWIELVQDSKSSNRKCLDHDHETGEVRGVICNKCNRRDVFKNC